MSIRESGKASSSLGLQDFDLLRVIGRGSYAKVLLVRLKKTERIYAMKVVKKELVNDDEVGKLFINKSCSSSEGLQYLPQGGSQGFGSAVLIGNYTCSFLTILYYRRFTRQITGFEVFIDKLVAHSCAACASWPLSLSFVISTVCSSAPAEFNLSLVCFLILEQYSIFLLLCWLAGLKKKWVESGFHMLNFGFLVTKENSQCYLNCSLNQNSILAICL